MQIIAGPPRLPALRRPISLRIEIIDIRWNRLFQPFVLWHTASLTFRSRFCPDQRDQVSFLGILGSLALLAQQDRAPCSSILSFFLIIRQQLIQLCLPAFAAAGAAGDALEGFGDAIGANSGHCSRDRIAQTSRGRNDVFSQRTITGFRMLGDVAAVQKTSALSAAIILSARAGVTGREVCADLTIEGS